MSGSTSMSFVPRQPGPPPSLSASHRQTFSVPNRPFVQAPNSTGHSLPPPVVTAASTPTSRLSLKETSQVTAKNVLFYKSGDSNFEVGGKIAAANSLLISAWLVACILLLIFLLEYSKRNYFYVYIFIVLFLTPCTMET